MNPPAIRAIVCSLLRGEDYRHHAVRLIDEEFLQFTATFLKKIAEEKSKHKSISEDWYKSGFLNQNLSSDDIAIHSGLNRKTIHNMHRSSTKSIVLKTSLEHYTELKQRIGNLVQEKNLSVNLKIETESVSEILDPKESFLVINTLAVKRAAIRGGQWSAIGKRVEGPLMKTLCELYAVPPSSYEEEYKRDKEKKVDREVDFYLIAKGKKHRCEVKLMGAGNPESADAVIARDTNIFIASTLSRQNKHDFDNRRIHWVELQTPNGFRKFKKLLEALDIPHQNYEGEIAEGCEKAFDSANAPRSL